MKNYLFLLLLCIFIAPVWAKPISLDELPTGVMPLLAEKLAKENAADYAPKLHKNSVHLTNPHHNLAATFEQKGITLNVNNTQLEMELKSLGRGGEIKIIKPIQPEISGVKVVYKHLEIDHWFINSPIGLEQGFTLNEKPKGQGELKLALKLSSEYRAELKNNSLGFKDKAGQIKLNYGQLKSWDAQGKELKSIMSYNSKTKQLVLAINDTEASYPITIDPLFTNGRRMMVGGGNRYFGARVAYSGDILAVSDTSVDRDDVVHIFRRDSYGYFDDEQKLVASDRGSSYHFGNAIAIFDDTLVVGAVWEDEKGNNVGGVYLYRRGSDGVWGNEQKITASDKGRYDEFGTAVALFGDTLVVGAYGNDEKGSRSGAVYIYSRDKDGRWGSEQKLTASDGVDYNGFGTSVTISGNTLMVGAPWVNARGNNKGAVYIYSRSDDGEWGSEQKVIASDGGGIDEGFSDGFGRVIAFDGDTLATGVEAKDTDNNNSGAVYLYSRGDDSRWGNEQKLITDDWKPWDIYDENVAISGNTLIVGAPWAGERGNVSEVYFYSRNSNGIWGDKKRLNARYGSSDSGFGYAVVLSDDFLLVGDLENTIYFYDLELDFSLAINSSVATPLPNSQYSFSLFVTNNESASADGVQLSIILPGGLSYVSDDSGCTLSGIELNCDLGRMSTGLTSTVTIIVSADRAGEYELDATVTTENTATNVRDSHTILVNTPPSISGAPTTSVVHSNARIQWSTGRYGNNEDRSEVLFIPGADLLTVSVLGETESCCDHLYIYDENGNEIKSLRGNINEVFTINGSSITARLTTDGSATRSGVTVSVTGSSDNVSRYSFIPTASDADEDVLVFSITNKPVWASFNTETGELNGVPSITDSGMYRDIIIQVSDGIETAILDSFDIEIVNTAPLISGAPETSVKHDERYSFIPLAADSDGDMLVFSITNKPHWADFNVETGELSGVPLISDSSVYRDIEIQVSDGLETISLALFDIKVINTAPVISGAPVTSFVHDRRYSFTPQAYDADGDELVFSITNRPFWASFNLETGELSGTPTIMGTGIYRDIEIQVSDGVETATLAVFDIKIINIIPTISGTPGTSAGYDILYSFVPTAFDLDGDALEFSVSNLPVWADFNTETGELSGTPSLEHKGSSSENIIIRVSDGAEVAALLPFTIDVVEPVTEAKDDEKKMVNADLSGIYIINVLHNDTARVAGGLTVTISATTTEAGGTITINDDGTIGYEAPEGLIGNDSFTYTVTDVSGNTDTATVRIQLPEKDDLITRIEAETGSFSLYIILMLALFKGWRCFLASGRLHRDF